LLAQAFVGNAAQIITGLWIPGPADFVEDFGGMPLRKGFSKTQMLRDLG
jgi:hypothetical protein